MARTNGVPMASGKKPTAKKAAAKKKASTSSRSKVTMNDHDADDKAFKKRNRNTKVRATGGIAQKRSGVPY